jgi:hypothetical protein
VPYNAPNKDDGRPRTDALLNPFKDAFTLTGPAAARIPRTYVLCTAKGDASLWGAFNRAAARAKQGGVWRYRELPTGHTALWTMPSETAELLLEAASAD